MEIVLSGIFGFSDFLFVGLDRLFDLFMPTGECNSPANSESHLKITTVLFLTNYYFANHILYELKILFPSELYLINSALRHYQNSNV